LTFAPRSASTTFVEATESGFSGGGDALMQQVADSVEGFALMLASLKALLEQSHGVDRRDRSLPHGHRAESARSAGAGVAEA